MFFPGNLIQMQIAAEQLLASDEVANVVTAKLHWRVVTRAQGYDVNDEDTASLQGQVVAHDLDFRALFYQVDHRLSGFQRFVEVQTGDVILDYLADLDLEGKEDARIEVKGKFYVQKSASSELLEAMDVATNNGGLLKNILLVPAP